MRYIKIRSLLLFYIFLYFSLFNIIIAKNVQDECDEHSIFLERMLAKDFTSSIYQFENILNPYNYKGKKLQNFFNDLKSKYILYNKELFEKFDFYSEFDEGDELVYSQFKIFIDEKYYYDIIIIFSNSKIIRDKIPETYKQRKSLFKQMMNLTDYCIIQINVDFVGMINDQKNSKFKDLYKKLVKKREEIIKLKSKVDKNKKRK